MWIIVDAWEDDGLKSYPRLVNTAKADSIVEPGEGSPLWNAGIRAMIRLPTFVSGFPFDVVKTKIPLNDFSTSLGAQGF